MSFVVYFSCVMCMSVSLGFHLLIFQHFIISAGINNSCVLLQAVKYMEVQFQLLNCYIYCGPKNVTFLFLNNSVINELILIILVHRILKKK